MVSFIIVTFVIVVVILATTEVSAAGDDAHETHKTVRFALMARALCMIALVTAIIALVTYEGP